MAINFNDLPQEKPASQYALIPGGKYRCIIENAEMKTPKDETKPEYLNLQLEIFDDTGASLGKIWDIITESANEHVRYKISRLIKVFNIPFTNNFELKDLTKVLKGKEMMVDLKVDDSQDTDKTVVDIFSADIYYPVGEEKESTPVFEPEEDNTPSDSEY